MNNDIPDEKFFTNDSTHFLDPDEEMADRAMENRVNKVPERTVFHIDVSHLSAEEGLEMIKLLRKGMRGKWSAEIT